MTRIKLIYLLAAAIAFVLSDCGPKTVPTAVTDEYHEDLSATLPEIPEYVSPVEVDEVTERAAFTDPEIDITEALNSVLDSIAIIRKNIPYSQYTVLVHNSNSRSEADEARLNVFRVMPEAKPKIQFISPSYRVKVGTYFNRIDAYQTLVKLKKMFPNAVIVPEQVYID